MKKILGLLLLLVSFTSYGQFVNYTNINGRYKWIAGKFDSTFTLPSGTTPSLRTGGGTGPGALFYNTADSIVYQYTGSQWRPLHGSDTGRIQIAYVRNTTASQMTTGQVVYINGSTGNVPTVALAQNKQDSSSAMTFGFVRGNIAVNGFGWITTFGPIDGINTNAYTEGEVIYLDSVAGQFTHSKPQAPYHMVTLGYIVKKSANGIIFTKIQNGYELEELHNVRITAPVLNKSVIIYDSVKGYWVDTTVSAAGLGLGGSGTTNYLSKWTSSSALGNSLVYDNGTSVGVNTASPSASYKLDVVGTSRFTDNTSNAFVVDLGLTGIFKVLRNSVAHLQYDANTFTTTAYQFTSQNFNTYASNTSRISGGVLQFTSSAVINAISQDLPFQTSGTERMRLTANGRLLLGTAVESTYELDVVGDIRSTLDANINGLTVGKGGGSVANNTAIGNGVLNSNVTGDYNTIIGYRSGYLTTSSDNTFVGYNSGYSTTSNANTFVGIESGTNITTGANNTAIGSRAGKNTGVGLNNTFVGTSAGVNSTGSNNSYLGYLSGQTITGSGNTSIGTEALRSAGATNNNTAVGFAALYYTTTGGSNIGVGYNSGADITTGASNTIIGTNTGRGITTGQYNTIIGAGVTGLSSSLSNTIILADGQGNQRLYINSSGNAAIGTTSPITATNYTTFTIGNSGPGTASGSYVSLVRTGVETAQFFANGSTVALVGLTALPMTFATNGSERMRIFATTGNFSIGYGGSPTDAGYRLDISGTARVSGVLTVGTMTITGTATNQIAIGGSTTGNSSVAVGTASTAALQSIAIGEGANASQNSIAIGRSATTNAQGQVVFGGANNASNDIYFGRGITATTVENIKIQPNGASGTDIAGGHFTLTGGRATGNALSGDLIFQTSDATTSGTTLQSLTTKMILKGNGAVGIGTTSPNASALLDITSTTKGFLPPRMTGAQAEAIASPADGLLIYCNNGNGTTITSTGWWGYETSGWVKLN